MSKIKPDKDNCPECGWLTDRTIGLFMFSPKTGEFSASFDCPNCKHFWIYTGEQKNTSNGFIG